MHRVEIEATDFQQIPIDDEPANAQAFEQRRGQIPPRNPIPDHYNRNSTLTADVEADGENKFDFDLETATNRMNAGRQ
jgi:hypothetical protein